MRKHPGLHDHPRVPVSIPCSTTPANLALMDCNIDGGIDLSDAIYKLAFLFQRGPGQGQACIAIVDCPPNSSCPCAPCE